MYDRAFRARRREDRLTFANVDSDRLLKIDVASRFDRGDGDERVPMVRRSDENDVEIRLFERLAIVGELARFATVLTRRDLLGGLFERIAVDVANRDDVDIARRRSVLTYLRQVI